MTFGTEPLTLESPVCRELPILREKFVVDAVNGLDVAQARIRVQRKRGDIFDRLWDGLTGKGAKRQTEINSRVLDSLDGSIRWLSELTESMAKSKLGIVRVNEALQRLNDDLVGVADVAVEIRAELDGFRKAVDNRLSALEKRLDRVEASDRARSHFERVFNAWGAGRFGGISWAGRCYYAVEDLRWGDFGNYCRNYPEERDERLESVKDRAAIQMLADAEQASAGSRLPTRAWIDPPPNRLPDGVETLAYLGADHEDAPFVFAVTQGPMGFPWPDAVPLISSSSRIATALADEVLGGAR